MNKVSVRIDCALYMFREAWIRLIDGSGMTEHVINQMSDETKEVVKKYKEDHSIGNLINALFYIEDDIKQIEDEDKKMELRAAIYGVQVGDLA